MAEDEEEQVFQPKILYGLKPHLSKKLRFNERCKHLGEQAHE
jgi:hypothetical protein